MNSVGVTRLLSEVHNLVCVIFMHQTGSTAHAMLQASPSFCRVSVGVAIEVDEDVVQGGGGRDETNPNTMKTE